MTETSLQAQLLIPLVTSIAFGMMAATVLVLIMVPALYTILHDFNLTARLDEAEPGAEPALHPAQ
jgi:Cu/Ag efflux pump CusA